MNHALAQKSKASAARYYRDIPALANWQTRTESWLTRPYEALMFQRRVIFAGSMKGKSLLDLGLTGAFGWRATGFRTRPLTASFLP